MLWGSATGTKQSSTRNIITDWKKESLQAPLFRSPLKWLKREGVGIGNKLESEDLTWGKRKRENWCQETIQKMKMSGGEESKLWTVWWRGVPVWHPAERILLDNIQELPRPMCFTSRGLFLRIVNYFHWQCVITTIQLRLLISVRVIWKYDKTVQWS